MTPGDATTLIHLVGFMTGIVLYAMLAVMILQSRPIRELPPLNRNADRIPLATALLGLIWNGGALVIYGLRDLGVPGPAPLVVALAFSAVGFLPAVVVHSALATSAPRAGARVLVATSYLLSAVASAMHVHAALTTGLVPSRPALLTLTVGYAGVVALLMAFSSRQPTGRRALSAVALAAFAVMASTSASTLRPRTAGPLNS